MFKNRKPKTLFAIIAVLFLSLSISVPGSAKDHVKGHDKDKDAVSGKEEAEGTTEGALPAGWSKGKKTGWKKE